MRWHAAIAFAAVIATACGAAGPVADERLVAGTLTVDREFSPHQRVQVEKAVELWSEATGGRFRPRLTFGEVECGDPYAIEAVADEGCRVGQRFESPEGRLHVLGATDLYRHTIAVVSWLEGSSFRNNVAHEIGHYLLMRHGDGIMAQSFRGQPPVVTRDTLAEFCATWGCEELRDGE